MDAKSESEVKRLKLKIVGVPCASCIIPVRKALERTPGVVSVGANYLLDLILVDYDEKKIDQQDIIEVIARAGYKAVKTL
ncbi:MAG: heavy-metal-associated domain-containing protein [Conexivisphaerales archaeon]